MQNYGRLSLLAPLSNALSTCSMWNLNFCFINLLSCCSLFSYSFSSSLLTRLTPEIGRSGSPPAPPLLPTAVIVHQMGRWNYCPRACSHKLCEQRSSRQRGTSCCSWWAPPRSRGPWWWRAGNAWPTPHLVQPVSECSGVVSPQGHSANLS